MCTAVPNHGPLFLRQGVPWGVDRKAGLGGTHDEAVPPPSRTFSTPWRHSPIVQAFRRVGNDLVRVDAQDVPVAFTRAACTHWTVEVEHVRRRLGEEHAVPFKSVVEFPTRGGLVGASAPNLAPTTAFKKGGFHAVCNPSRIVFRSGRGEPVDDQPQHVRWVDILQPHCPVCGPCARISLLLEDAQLVLGCPVLSGLEWRHQHHAVIRALEHCVDNVRHAVFAHDFSRHWRTRFPDSGIQHAQVVQHLSAGANGASGTS